jgi:hypothetical protein
VVNDEILKMNEIKRSRVCSQALGTSKKMFANVANVSTFLSFVFSVDLTDAAIRHENGKQVARWNVDPNYSSPEASGASLGYPSAVGSGHHPFLPLSGHVPHPNAVSGNRTQVYTTGQMPRHPNGKNLRGTF